MTAMTTSSRGGDGDGEKLVDCSAEEMVEAGHTAVVPSPFVATGDLFGRVERTTTDGGACHLGPVYGPCDPGCLASGRRQPPSMYPILLTCDHHPLLHGGQEGVRINQRPQRRSQ